MKETVLSIGRLIRALLLENEQVAKITQRVFPVWTDKAALPYITYYREKLVAQPVKCGASSLTARISVECLAAGYDDAVALAEAVSQALDHAVCEDNGLSIRSCVLVDSVEDCRDDAYIEKLVFEVK
jgi:hypothetical protein